MTDPSTPRVAALSILVSAIGLAAAVATARLTHFAEFWPRFTVSAAGVSLAFSVCAALTQPWSGRWEVAGRRQVRLSAVFRAAALAVGVAATLALVTLLVTRGRVAIIELWTGPPLEQRPAFAFFAGGMVSWALLTGACGLHLATTGDRRLIAPLFWLAVVGVTWASLRVPVHVQTPTGVYARSAWALLLAGGLAGLLCGFVIVQGVLGRRHRARWLQTDPRRLLQSAPNEPGFRGSAAAAGLVLILLTCYHCVVGFDAEPVGRRLAALAMTCIAAGGAAALLVLLGRGWSVNLADIGMGLVCLVVCCATVAALPGSPTALVQRHPLVLNALLIGLALTTWLWNWLSCVWRQQLDAGMAWTTAGRMIAPATGMAFVAGVAALVVASLMAVWPRLPMVSTMDHSIGRMVGGVAGHLALLWAVLWGARRVGQARFVGLAVLAMVSLLAFVYVRTIPLTTSGF